MFIFAVLELRKSCSFCRFEKCKQIGMSSKSKQFLNILLIIVNFFSNSIEQRQKWTFEKVTAIRYCCS